MGAVRSNSGGITAELFSLTKVGLQNASSWPIKSGLSPHRHVNQSRLNRIIPCWSFYGDSRARNHPKVREIFLSTRQFSLSFRSNYNSIQIKTDKAETRGTHLCIRPQRVQIA